MNIPEPKYFFSEELTEAASISPLNPNAVHKTLILNLFCRTSLSFHSAQFHSLRVMARAGFENQYNLNQRLISNWYLLTLSFVRYK
jgi:hypothetical protein